MKKRIPEMLLALFIILYVAFFSYFSVVRHNAFYSSYYDMGIMDQTVYNTFRGRFLELTDPEGLTNIKRMTIHNDIFLALLAPFYAIYNGAETLLILQSIIIAFGAWGLYLLGMKILKNKWLSLLIAFAYLMFPPLQRANIFDFHAVSVVPTFLIFMFYFGETKKYLWSFVFMLLAVSTKEQVALTTGVYGLYTLLSYQPGVRPRRDDRVSDSMFLRMQRFYRSFHSLQNDKKDDEKRKFGWGMVIFSGLWIVLISFVLIPFFGKNASHFAMSRYSHFGSTPIGIIKGVLVNPFLTLSYIFDIDTLRYFWFMYGPTIFLSFLSPLIMLIPIFDFAINLLSNDSNMKNIIYQYTSVITPFVFISAIYGLRKICDKFTQIHKGIWGLAIFLSVMLFSLTKSPLPFSHEAELHPFLYPAANIKEINEWVVKLSDENLIVSTTPRLASHFTHHKTFYVFDERYEKSDYIVIAKSDISERQYPYDAKIDSIYLSLQKSTLFEKIYTVGNLEVYKRTK